MSQPTSPVTCSKDIPVTIKNMEIDHPKPWQSKLIQGLSLYMLKQLPPDDLKSLALYDLMRSEATLAERFPGLMQHNFIYKYVVLVLRGFALDIELSRVSPKPDSKYSPNLGMRIYDADPDKPVPEPKSKTKTKFITGSRSYEDVPHVLSTLTIKTEIITDYRRYEDLNYERVFEVEFTYPSTAADGELLLLRAMAETIYATQSIKKSEADKNN
jgi:hypothetical protein